MSKSTVISKNYGKPYPRRHLLMYGDIKEISQTTGLTYQNVSQQISGKRKITPVVLAAADMLANRMQSKINSFEH